MAEIFAMGSTIALIVTVIIILLHIGYLSSINYWSKRAFKELQAIRKGMDIQTEGEKAVQAVKEKIGTAEDRLAGWLFKNKSKS